VVLKGELFRKNTRALSAGLFFIKTHPLKTGKAKISDRYFITWKDSSNSGLPL
jgi:hypothetical protein